MTKKCKEISYEGVSAKYKIIPSHKTNENTNFLKSSGSSSSFADQTDPRQIQVILFQSITIDRFV